MTRTLELPVTAVAHDRAEMAETPVWSPAEGALYWIDIRREYVYRLALEGGRRDAWPIGSTVGSIGLRGAGGLVVASRRGLEALDVATGALAPIAQPEANRPGHRLNDGKTDRAGRFWVGSVNDPGLAPTGRLFRCDPDGAVTIHEEGVIMSNALAFSPDDRTLYFGDSYVDTIWAYDFDLAAGTIRNRRVFATTAPGEGRPDGATVDAEGYLWSARVGGSSLARYAPDGRLDAVVPLPASRPTSVTFGGPGLRTLFVTTGASRLSPEELAAQPLAGAILALEPGVAGLPEPSFGTA